MITPEPAPPLVKPEFALIEDLFREIEAGRVRVPNFHRAFVWTPTDMLTLLDGIRKGYPIGSLLMWDTTEPVQSADLIGPIVAPREMVGGVASYVLDGQQRISTLYGVLRLGADFPRETDQKHWQWWVYYDLRDRRFLHVPRGYPAPSTIPLRALLRTRDFLQEARRITEAHPTNEAAALIDEAEGLAQRFKSYKISIIRIEGALPEQAVEIFSRLNTTGQPMTADQMISALTPRDGPEDFDLASYIDGVAEMLDVYGFGDIRRDTIFRTFLIAAGIQPYGVGLPDMLRALHGNTRRAAEEAGKSLVDAARFLSVELGVRSNKLLPYSHQLLLLSEFFRCCSAPSSDQIATLRKWFWATSFSGWFAGANSTQIREALKEFRELATGTRSKLEAMGLDERCRPFPQTFDIRSARLRTLLLVMMQRLVPRQLDGEKLDPGPLLWEHGNRAFLYVFRRAADEVVSSPANRILLPASRGQVVRKQLLELPPEFRDVVLASHGIDDEAYSALIADDASAFINARARHLAQVERAFMAELGLTPPAEEFGDADIDTDDD